MTIELTTFSAPQPGYKDKRIGNFALAFERKERRSATFANILVDATWATWMVHDDFPANEANAEIVLTGEASFYPDYAMIHIPAPHAEQAKNAFAVLMATWAQGQSTVLGYSVEESIVLAYRDKGPAGLFAFLLCSYMEAPSIEDALQSVGLHSNQYTIVPTEEERSGDDFLSSMRDNDPLWFKTLQDVGIIDEQSIVLGENDDEGDDE